MVWPNQAFLKDVIKPHQRVVLFGRAEYWGSRGLQLTAPEFEVLPDDAEGEPLHTGRIVPIYERTGVVTPNMHRRLVHDVLALLTAPLDELLPPALVARERWPDRRTALRQAHFPDPGTDLEALNAFGVAAQRRLIFEDFFVYQTGLALRRRQNAAVRKPHVATVDDALRSRARAVLPFKLTAGQRTALRDIVADLQRPWPMQRLLQGDVGSGKTVVAFMAALVAMENGFQAALMAPTEILAEQHLRTLEGWLFGTRFRVGLLTGRVGDAARRRLMAEVAAGEVHLVVGTHALVQDDVGFRALVPGGDRRAAPLRRPAARHAGGEGAAPRRPADDGDADSTDAGAHRLRRHGRHDDARPAAGAPANPHRRAAVDPSRRGLPADARGGGRRPSGLCHLSDHRDVGEDRPEGRHRNGGAPGRRRVSRSRRRAAARPAQGRAEGHGHAPLRGRRGPRAGEHDRRRGRRRRAQRHRDGRRARRAVRPGPAAPAARPHRPRRARLDVRAALRHAVERRGQGAAVGDGRVRGRVPARGTGPGAARAGRRLRHPAVGDAAAAGRRPGARCRSARAGPSRSAGPGRRRRRAAGAGRARRAHLAGRLRPGAGG